MSALKLEDSVLCLPEDALIIFVHLEHARLRQIPLLWRYFATAALEAKYRLEEISGRRCLIVRHDRLTPQFLHRFDVRAVVVGGNYTGFQHFEDGELAGLQEVFRQASWPTLAICGGFQLLAKTYGAEIGPMDPAADKSGHDILETDTPMPPDLQDAAGTNSGKCTRIERGFLPVRIRQPHPLFRDMTGAPVLFQLHGGEVRTPAQGFRILAESDLCRIQAVAHTEAPLFGTQFHPEIYDDAHPDGGRILENFFRIVEGRR